MTGRRPEFVVVGAGVFGVWIAYRLRLRGHAVTLLDAYGAGNSRSSSGDESRIIRMGYGGDALYTRWAVRSLEAWKQLFERRRAKLFVETGMLWLGREGDAWTQQIGATLEAQNVSCERLSAEELQKRFPQFSVENIPFAVYEPHSGVLLARRAVAAVLEAAIEGGVEYRTAAVMPPDEPNRISALRTSDGGSVEGETFIFACGSWLPKVFPALLGERIFPTRQEVFYFGAPAGANEFRPPAMPTWLDHEAQMYGMPDIESRGLKIACDRHGQSFDPDAGERLASEEGRLEVRTYLQQRFPGLPEPRVVETRVCQYENTCNGDFLLDRHPEFDNVWLAGGGSGHGFKHGPMVGEYMAGRILDGAEAEGRFSCAAKLQVQARSVY